MRMLLQRARGAVNRAENKSSNGPLRVQSKAMPSILQRVDIRQLSGICMYPAKRTAPAVNQGGTASEFIRP